MNKTFTRSKYSKLHSFPSVYTVPVRYSCGSSAFTLERIKTVPFTKTVYTVPVQFCISSSEHAHSNKERLCESVTILLPFPMFTLCRCTLDL